MPHISPELLLKAYAYGVFPMARSREEKEVFWVQPKTRAVLPLENFHVPRSLRKILRKQIYDVRCDTAFSAVLSGCAEPQADRRETWINDQIFQSFADLHESGLAHSVEVWREGRLVGGLYGLAMGSAFFGESMFRRESNASKIALCYLVAILKNGNYTLLDTQFMTDHLRSCGALEISHKEYMRDLKNALGRIASFNRQLDYLDVARELSIHSKTHMS